MTQTSLKIWLNIITKENRMKVWWVFAMDNCFPFGGMDDFKQSFSSEPEAQSYADSIQWKYNIVRVVNVREMLL